MDCTRESDTQYWYSFLALGWEQGGRAKKEAHQWYPWHHTKRRPKAAEETYHLADAQLFPFRVTTVSESLARGPG